MLFKNLTSGIIWDIVHPDHIKRCEDDENYEKVVEDKPKASAKRVAKKDGEK